MVTRNSVVSDLESAMNTAIHFVADPDDASWYRGDAERHTLYLRIGDFPAEEAFSLYLGHGRWMDFSTPPTTWTIATPKQWPPTARPRLPKGEFHE